MKAQTRQTYPQTAVNGEWEEYHAPLVPNPRLLPGVW